MDPIKWSDYNLGHSPEEEFGDAIPIIPFGRFVNLFHLEAVIPGLVVDKAHTKRLYEPISQVSDPLMTYLWDARQLGFTIEFVPDKKGYYYEFNILNGFRMPAKDDNSRIDLRDWYFRATLGTVTPSIIEYPNEKPTFWLNHILKLELRYPLRIITNGFKLDPYSRRNLLEESLLNSPLYSFDAMTTMRRSIVLGNVNAQVIPSGDVDILAFHCWLESFLLRGDVSDRNLLLNRLYLLKELREYDDNDIDVVLRILIKNTLKHMQEDNLAKLREKSNGTVSEEDIISKGIDLYLILAYLRASERTPEQRSEVRGYEVLPIYSVDMPKDFSYGGKPIPSKAFIDRLRTWCINDQQESDEIWSYIKQRIMKKIQSLYPSESATSVDQAKQPLSKVVGSGTGRRTTKVTSKVQLRKLRREDHEDVLEGREYPMINIASDDGYLHPDIGYLLDCYHLGMISRWDFINKTGMSPDDFEVIDFI